MAEVCAWCGRELEARDRRGGRVRTKEGIICEQCTPAYFRSLRDPGSRPPLRAKLEEQESAPLSPEADTAPPSSETEDEAPSEEGQADAYELLDEIRKQVNQIRQSLVYAETSVWNVFAALAQTFAVAALGLAAATWASGPTEFLLVAILLQLMALTFFLNGK